MCQNEPKKIPKKRQGLLNLPQELWNVGQACRMMGYLRDSFYHFKNLDDG